MKKKILISILLILTLILCSCTTKNGSGNIEGNHNLDNKSLYDHGFEVISLLVEMIGNEEYREAMNNSTELQDIAGKIQDGDYSTPKTVYQVTITEDEQNKLLAMNNINQENLTDTLGNYMKKKMLVNVINLLNVQYGTSYLAASSIYTAEKYFVCNEMSEDVIYIYTYESGFPIIITFVTGDDGIVIAKGTFIFDEQFDVTTEQDVKDYLSEKIYLTDCEVEQIQVK